MNAPIHQSLASILVVLTCITYSPAMSAQDPAEGQAAVASPAPKISRAERAALAAQGRTALDTGDFSGCARSYEAALDFYMAAACQSMAGNVDAAFVQLARAIDGKHRDLSRHDKDSNFNALRADPRWASERERLIAKIAADEKTWNPELVQIYKEDQADRKNGPIDWTKVTPRDQARRQQVEAIIAAGGAKVSFDYFRAAMVFQHGEKVAEIERAHELALKAVELDPEHDVARWLVAATEDRKLTYEKKPQKWGTQYHQVDGKWVLMEVDPTTTNEQRAEWNVPPIHPPAAAAKHP